MTDRYTKAIEQLGSDKLDVRIGGIYALERVARDSARDHSTVMEVLTAFIREHSREPWPPPGPGSQEQVRSTRSWLGLGTWTRTTRAPSREQARSTRPDVQAAVTVVGRRDVKRDLTGLDLTGADLGGADLFGDFSNVDLSRADLTDASLSSANLTDAWLNDAILVHARLMGANFTGARLWDANLTGAKLHVEDLFDADIADADLTDVTDPDVDLTGAYLDR